MSDDGLVPLPLNAFQPVLPSIAAPHSLRVTICFAHGDAPVAYKNLPGDPIRFVIRPLPPEDNRPEWAVPGICGALATLWILKGYGRATSRHFCDLLFLHPYWYMVFVAAARVAMRTGHAPADSQEAIVDMAYLLAQAKTSEMDWRAELDTCRGRVGARLRRLALDCCREAKRQNRKAEDLKSRSKRFKREMISDEQLREHPDPPAAVDRSELLAATRQAIASLPEAERYVLEHHTMGRETLSAVAAALGISVGQTRVLEHRAIRGARRELALKGWLMSEFA
ncbi:MAG TPA: sigma-70 family RNA polymerase sigma factor [Pirellulales bacterium]|nr:sigma-70 family RNA polymerase sigma factor [Pirellulales bacterium]